jgi:hypothetical protein
MGPGMDEGERERVAEELRRVRAEARRELRSDPGREEPDRAAGPPSPRQPEEDTGEPESSPPAPPPAPPARSPDTVPVNAAWRADPVPPSGPTRFVYRLLDRILRPRFDAQREFNARQVRLDNEALRYLEERIDATHRHYDRLLGLLGRRLDEVDERHVMLEKELVAHVHDLVERIDLVLAEATRGRLGLQFALEELRVQVERLEQALGKRR